MCTLFWCLMRTHIGNTPMIYNDIETQNNSLGLTLGKL